MKPTLLLLPLLFLALPAHAADREKPERKSRTEKKDDTKDEKKEEVRNQFEARIEGAKDTTAESDVKTFLSKMEGVKVESSEKTEKGLSVVLSSKGKITRGDVAKALKDNKDLKVAEFKAVRPGREKKEEAKDDKTDKPAVEPKKPA